MNAERGEKIKKEFDRRFETLPKSERNSIMNMEFDDLAKFTGIDAVMSVRATLMKDPEDQQRIFDPNWKLLPYIFLKIKNLKKDVERLKQSKILARVINPGESILNEKKFVAGKFYAVRDIKRIENLQSQHSKRIVTYTVFPQASYSFNIIIDDEFNIAMALVASQQIKEAAQMSNKENDLEKLRIKISGLNEKCKNLLQEFSKRLDTSMKEWAEEKGIKYEQLKLNYHRCVEKLRQTLILEES